MGHTLNINEFRRFAPDIQNKIMSDLLQKSLTGNDNVFESVKKSSGYLSDWNNNVVQIDVSVDRTKKNILSINLSDIHLQCKGELSIFPGTMPLTAFPNLTQAAKGLINILDATFTGNTKKSSIITNGLNNGCRFFSYIISHKGVYTLGALNRKDFVDFIQEMKSKEGWLNLLDLDDALLRLVAELNAGTITIGDVCRVRHNNGSYKVSISRNYINRYTGIPGATGKLPRWFYEELLKLHGDKYSVNTGIETYFSGHIAHSYIKSINRLYDLPPGFDKPRFRPYPDPIALAYGLSGEERSRLDAKKGDGRTANLSLEDALKLFRECLSWIYDYSNGIIEILFLFRQKLEDIIPEFDKVKYSTAQKKLSNDIELKLDVSSICNKYKLPFENVVLNSHCAGYDKNSCPSVSDLIDLLHTACFIMIATNNGRRYNEVVGSHQLNYGLYFGCLTTSDELNGVNFIDIYVEKTLKDYADFYANQLVVDAVKLLEQLSQVFRPLFTEPKEYCSDVLLARKDKLFVSREFTLKSFISEPTSYNFGVSARGLYERAGVANEAIDNRTHPFRRFFALLYYYRYDMPDLFCVMDALGQLDPATTTGYVRDPGMRRAANRIDELYHSRLHEEIRQVESDMEDVRTEMFASTVLEILKGKRSGGIWPQIVLKVYQNLSENAEFDHLDLVGQGTEVANKMVQEGYNRVPFEHGGCNVGTSQLTISEALCKRKDEDIPHLEDASPQMCVNCVHHDCSFTHIKRLKQETARLLAIEEDFSLPLFLRIESREQRESLEGVIRSEMMLSQKNQKILHTMTKQFTNLVDCSRLIEEALYA